MPQWVKWLGPIAEHVTHVFGKATAGTYSAATPLTRVRTCAAQAMVKARKTSARYAAASSTALQKPAATSARPSWTCPDCGQTVTNPRHVRCEARIDADPASTPEIRGRRGAADRGSEAKALRVGSGESRPVYDPELFRRARLGNMPLAEVMEAAGCCKASASDYRRGKRTPHVSTWANWLIRRVPRSPWSRTAGGPTIEGWRKRKR